MNIELYVFLSFVLFFIGLLIPIGLIVLLLFIRSRVRKNREEEYFRRMYWTIRQAHEDADKDKHY